jgi:hypothetical protein
MYSIFALLQTRHPNVVQSSTQNPEIIFGQFRFPRCIEQDFALYVLPSCLLSGVEISRYYISRG